MDEKNIIIVPAYIDNPRKLYALQRNLEHIRKYSNVPIFLSISGDMELIKEQFDKVDHYIYTSVNSLIELTTPLSIFHQTSNWKITYNIPCPRYYHGLAHMQKISIALDAAMALGYDNFLVLNYDAFIMDDRFIDHMFSHKLSVFFRYETTTFTNTDIFKLNRDGAELIKRLGQVKSYKYFSHNVDAEMVENAVTNLINTYSLNCTILPAANCTAYQIPNFNVLVNTISSGEATAGLLNNKIMLLVTSQGSPAHTLDGKISIECNGTTTDFDVSEPISLLYPIADYEGKDLDLLVHTSLGTYPITVTKKGLENTVIEWY